MGMKFSLRHARSGAGYLLPATLCVITAAACGSATSASSAPKSSASASASAAAARVSLTVVVKASPGASPERWTLRCDPTGGTHPDAKAACRQLLAAKNPFAPIPRGIMCPMIAAGPQLGDVFGLRAGSASGAGAESGSPVH